MVRTLLRQHVPIEHVTLGPTTEIQGTTLSIRADICQETLHADALVVDVQLDIIGPDRYNEYSQTIMDVQPIATKQQGALGAGVTRVLDGVVAVVTGTDERGGQIGEFGSSEGPMHRTIMWGRPGAPDPGDFLVKTNVTIKANTQMERPGPLAAHKAAEVITQEIRRALKEADERCVVSTEELVHSRRPGNPTMVSHGGYDNADANRDINCMFPLDRLRELAAEGFIQRVAASHIGFMGGGGDTEALAHITGPEIAQQLRAEGVDAVVMTAG